MTKPEKPKRPSNIECYGQPNDLEPNGKWGKQIMWDEWQAYHRQAIKELLERVLQYAVHDNDCISGQWRQGRPTEDGGYETQYGYGDKAKWYKRGEKVPCTCGLDEIYDELAKLEEEG